MTWLTSKVQADDVAILKKIGQASKLWDCVDVGYRLKRGEQAGTVSSFIPEGARPDSWEKARLMRKGIELGGHRAMTATGREIYKGLNVFPGRLIGAPMGRWDGSTRVNSVNLYRYQELLDTDRLFVSREIAQLPTIAPVPHNAIFNNTVILIQLKERFPLNGWVLSRPVMFAAATCLRATVIEDLACHWYSKNLGLLPMPANITDSDRQLLVNATRCLVDADENLANRWRAVELSLVGQATKSLNQLIADGSELVEGLVLPAGGDEVEINGKIFMTETGLATKDGSFSLSVPHHDLRALLWYLIEIEQADVSAEITMPFFGRCSVPIAQLGVVAAEIRTAHEAIASEQFDAARTSLDELCAYMLGLKDSQLAHIQERFLSDPFLSLIQPKWAHRGLHVQGYHDHSGGDRFTA